MVRSTLDVRLAGGVRWYVLACGHEVLADDYQPPPDRLKDPRETMKALAFCPRCWLLEQTHPAEASA